MTINEMHLLFRTLGQQMGIQTIRGILPESIDLYINDAINEKVRSTVINNTNINFQDKISVQNNFISPINALRTLYKNYAMTIQHEITFIPKYYKIDIIIPNVMLYTSFSVSYEKDKFIKCRFIEGDKLEDTLSDYCNTASLDNPIITMFGELDNIYAQLYTNSVAKPMQLKINYIENPTIVKWSSNINDRIDCNLPIYEHNEIVELAVNKFFKSLGFTSQQVTQN